MIFITVYCLKREDKSSAKNTCPFMKREVVITATLWFYTSSFLCCPKRRFLYLDENKFKTNLRKRIERELPGSMVYHLSAHDKQGSPDLLVLYKGKWATLEGKKTEKASHRPNQDYYVDLMNKMSFSRFIYPENEEEVLDELYRSLQSGGKTRNVRRK